MKRPAFNIEWSAHAYEHKERGEDWFWAVGIIAISLAIVAVIFSDIIFGILILISAFALCLFINRPPEDVHVVINERGVTRGHVHYPYETLKAFWVVEEHNHPKILFHSQKWFMPLIIVPLGHKVDVEALEEKLLQSLPRHFYKVPWLEEMLENLGF
jgi:hypothetical protein